MGFFYAVFFSIIYLSTTLLLDQRFIALSILFIPFYFLFPGEGSIKNRFKDLFSDKFFLILVLIAVLSFLNRLFHLDLDEFEVVSLYSFGILYPINYFAGLRFRLRWVRAVLFALISVEVLVGVMEYIWGVSTFFQDNLHFREFTSYRLLYFTRVLGLSPNSSTLAIKLLFSLLLVDREKDPFLIKWVPFLRSLFVVGLFLTFNRAVFLACFIYWGLLILQDWSRTGIPEWLRSWKKVLVRPSLFYGLLFAVMILGAQETYFQFKRGMNIKSGSEMTQEGEDTGGVEAKEAYFSGRTEIWKKYWEHIVEDPLFGTGSDKLWIKDYHAHSSYLQVLSSHGVIIFLFYLLLIAFGFTRWNYPIVISIIVLGFFQYAFFWGLSLPDFIFLYLLHDQKTREDMMPLGVARESRVKGA